MALIDFDAYANFVRSLKDKYLQELQQNPAADVAVLTTGISAGHVGNNTATDHDDMITLPAMYSYLFSGGGNDVVHEVADKSLAARLDDGDDVYVGVDAPSAFAATVFGGYGNDTMTGTGDALFGEEGDDVLTALGVYNDTMHGGSGNDTIVAGAGDDVAMGGAGDDHIFMGEGNDAVDGNSGDDTIYSGNGADSLWGGAGNDTLIAGTSTSGLTIGLANPTLSGDDKLLNGGSGNDTIIGGNGADVIKGALDTDTIYAGAGDDTVYGGGSVLDTLDKQDAIYAGLGSDLVYGNAGDDTLYGGDAYIDLDDGNDTIYGGVGNDLIYGNAGNDLLYGGVGNDALYGGLGDDTINLDWFGGVDTVYGFNDGTAGFDKLQIVIGINGTDIADFATLMTHASENADGVYIDLGNGNGVQIDGYTIDEMQAGHFEFV